MLDVLVRAPMPLAHGSDVRGQIEFHPGGSAANFAVWASRLGCRVSFLGALGDDFMGDYLLSDLRAEGVDARGVVRLPGRSPSVFALVGSDGERTMVTDRRVTLLLGPEHVAPDRLAPTHHLHLTAYSLFDPGPAAAAQAAVEAARVASLSLDLSSEALLRAHGASRTREEIGQLGPDVLFGNEPECLALCEASSLESATASLATLAPVVVVKRGRLGCLLLRGNNVLEVPTRAVVPLDTTGAGDAFGAAWVCAWLRGEGETRACEVANGVAARVVLAPGARGEAQVGREEWLGQADG